MDEHKGADTDNGLDADAMPANSSALSKRIILLLVVSLFVGVVAAKAVFDGTGSPSASGSAVTSSITSVHNDALADYEAAMKSGKPVYVLFHSLSCQPCIEISAVVDRVMPDYQGRVVFVNAISDDKPAQQLASRFQFQYIPTSFFMRADGSVKESFTGSMDEQQLRAYLDALVANK